MEATGKEDCKCITKERKGKGLAKKRGVRNKPLNGGGQAEDGGEVLGAGAALVLVGATVEDGIG